MKNTIYVRKPLYALIEINSSQIKTNFDGLQLKLIPLINLEYFVDLRSQIILLIIDPKVV